jgi:uncharacterized membrane protein
VPVIRQKAILFHRINGYLVVVLMLFSHAGALMIVRRAFGGGLDTQAAVGLLVIITTISFATAIYNIKKLQIDQHRAWMLRAMFYMGTMCVEPDPGSQTLTDLSITTRIILIIAALIISNIGSYYTTLTCGEIDYIQRDDPEYLAIAYPECTPGNESLHIAVKTSFSDGRPEQIGASMRMTFGMGLWLALFLHAVGVEIYLSLTPRESERLRQVSYERQLEAGAKNPGSAGLVVERFGDAEPWVPLQRSEERTKS